MAGGSGTYGSLVGAGLTFAGVDQGIDFTGRGDVFALDNGTVTSVKRHGSGWPGEGGQLVYLLTAGPNKGKHVYIAEDFAPNSNLRVGSTVTKGQKIGLATGSGKAPGIECGWSDASGRPIAQPPALNTPEGRSFEQYVKDGKTAAGGGGDSSGQSGGDSGVSAEEFMSLAKAATFAAALEFPSAIEVAEAVGLQGQKSLLNDKPLMPFIQQLADASLRKFMSTPDGKVFFFFPDYFGEANHRPPYWLIDDIEVLDGTINLADDALATHVYVIGDTSNSGNEMLNALWSAGTITIYNAFMAETGFLNHQPKGNKNPTLNTLVDHNDAVNFLQRYGARPLVENMPMIHNPYFEMFYAYQLFLLAWSRQFLSQFEFTFMPELFPGGKVGFPDHGLQMYIEEINHQWDMEEGYRTSATLSAPAQMGPDSQLPPDMVQAIIKPVKGLPPPKPPKRQHSTK